MAGRASFGDVLRNLVMWPMVVLLLSSALLFHLVVGIPCLGLWARYGLWAEQCPSGVRLEGEISASGEAGEEGTVWVRPVGVFLQGEGVHAWEQRGTLWRGVSVDLWLRDRSGERVQAAKVRAGGRQAYVLNLRGVPDGDYTLVAELETGFDRAQVELDLPLYAPALAHALPDRPLVQPGGEVRVRSVTLRADSRAPVEGRPGRWQLLDPAGELVWEERAQTGAFGMADTSFPIDREAPVGTWSVVWLSGETRAVASFEVRTFQLPPAELTVTTPQRWYKPGEPLVLTGVARTMAGAPLRELAVQVSVRGDAWPVPLTWEGPHEALTDARGAYRVELGPVPSDLVGRSVLTLAASVVEPGGSQVLGTGSVVLSTEALRIEAVTELGEGLVGGFNNRAYLRVSTPDGRALAGTEIVVSNPWLPDEGVVRATTDADGVASLQLDPRDPVTVVVPAPPVRARPVARREAELVRVSELGVDQVGAAELRYAAERAVQQVGECADRLVEGDTLVELALRLDARGTATAVVGEGPLAACVGGVMRAVRWPAGEVRTVELAWRLYDPPIDQVDGELSAAGGAPASLSAWAVAVRGGARSCLARAGSDRLEAALHWRLQAGRADVEVEPGQGMPGGALGACLKAAWSAPMSVPAEADAMGVLTLRRRAFVPPGSVAPTDGTRMAYELLVRAGGDEGRLIVPVGALPDLRVRVEPALVLPGETVVATLLRGPGFRGELPEHLYLEAEGREPIKAPVIASSRSASFVVPEDLRGVATIAWGGAQGLIFVRDPAPLSVTLATGAASYRPGERVSLEVRTTAGGAPVQAGVGLVGVDAALAQLAPLPGPDALGGAFVRLQAAQPAFGVFTPAALALGQISGEHAARAALLRVSGVAEAPSLARRLSGSASRELDARSELNDAFYEVYEALLPLVVQWEQGAPAGELMTPSRMAALWEQALEQVEDRQGKTRDAFGRRLVLQVLPDDLLAELDPHRLVSVGTRLPEDVVDWMRYVREESR